jgi:serine/threonine-protein kinase
MAGITLGQISRIDYAAPVVAIQKQFAKLRRTYVISGIVVGLPWWIMWMPFATVVFGLLGVDQRSYTLNFYGPGTLVGIAGLLATWGLHRWSRRPARATFGKALDDSLTGSSLRKAMARIDEIARFEQE